MTTTIDEQGGTPLILVRASGDATLSELERAAQQAWGLPGGLVLLEVSGPGLADEYIATYVPRAA